MYELITLRKTRICSTLKNTLNKTTRLVRRARNMAALLALLLPVTNINISKAELASPEYAIKAAYIYNILRFVNWQDVTAFKNTDSIKVCILGKHKFDQYLNPIKNKTIEAKPIQVNIIHAIDKIINCQLVFVGDSKTYPLENISEFVSDKKIVVLGDEFSFAENGGMFAFFVRDKRVHLAVNENALEKSGLKVSSLLLEICTVIGDSQ